jgi:hypothetical protein
MASKTLLNRAAADAAGTVRDLLVLRQHPDTRAIVPIARLSQLTNDGYSFRYTRGAQLVDGLRSLPGLPDFEQTYRFARLPALFRERVMDPSRSDYTAYILALGLEPSLATPWEQIATTGGRRAGDTLQFMEVPRVERGRVAARFLANGVRHIPEGPVQMLGQTVTVSHLEHEQALASLSPGAPVHVVAEENNSHDAHASLVTSQGVPVGWVPACLSAGFRDLLAAGPVVPTVAVVRGPSVPSHLRLVLDLNVPAPHSGFTFDPDGLWEPL